MALAAGDRLAGASRTDEVKLGFVTKFPVDFFFTLENAAKEYAAAHPDVEVLFGRVNRRPMTKVRSR